MPSVPPPTSHGRSSPSSTPRCIDDEAEAAAAAAADISLTQKRRTRQVPKLTSPPPLSLPPPSPSPSGSLSEAGKDRVPGPFRPVSSSVRNAGPARNARRRDSAVERGRRRQLLIRVGFSLLGSPCCLSPLRVDLEGGGLVRNARHGARPFRVGCLGAATWLRGFSSGRFGLLLPAPAFTVLDYFMRIWSQATLYMMLNVQIIHSENSLKMVVIS